MSNPSSDSTDASQRPWVAALLGAILPGLGHVYIRMWIHGIPWFLLYIATLVFYFPSDSIPESVTVGELGSIVSGFPTLIGLFIVSIIVLNALDAYHLAIRMKQSRERPLSGAPEDDGTASCPNCGKEVDAELDFCHWCTVELDTDAEELDA